MGSVKSTGVRRTQPSGPRKEELQPGEYALAGPIKIISLSKTDPRLFHAQFRTLRGRFFECSLTNLCHMSQIANQQCPLPTLTFDTQSYSHYTHWFQEQFVTTASSVACTVCNVNDRWCTVSDSSLTRVTRRTHHPVRNISVRFSETVRSLSLPTHTYIVFDQEH